VGLIAAARAGVPYITEGAEVVAKITGGQVDDELAARRRRMA